MAYNPWRDAAQRMPDVHIERCHLSPARGAWVESERVILLDIGLDRVGLRTTLAHEMAHADNGDHRCSTAGPDGPRLARRRELAADTLAAGRLISLEELADALSWARGPDEVAAELEVTVPMLRRRLSMLTDDEQAWMESKIADIEGAA